MVYLQGVTCLEGRLFVGGECLNTTMTVHQPALQHCGLLLQMTQRSVVCLHVCLCLSVGHDRKLCKNGQMIEMPLRLWTSCGLWGPMNYVSHHHMGAMSGIAYISASRSNRSIFAIFNTIVPYTLWIQLLSLCPSSIEYVSLFLNFMLCVYHWKDGQLGVFSLL